MYIINDLISLRSSINANEPNESYEFLNNKVFLHGIQLKITDHISQYVSSISVPEKISLIQDALHENITISPETLEYESINTICHEIIVTKIFCKEYISH